MIPVDPRQILGSNLNDVYRFTAETIDGIGYDQVSCCCGTAQTRNDAVDMVGVNSDIPEGDKLRDPFILILACMELVSYVLYPVEESVTQCIR